MNLQLRQISHSIFTLTVCGIIGLRARGQRTSLGDAERGYRGDGAPDQDHGTWLLLHPLFTIGIPKGVTFRA